jgi:hypothetical protein
MTAKVEDDAFFEAATGTKVPPEEVTPVSKSQQRRIEVVKPKTKPILKNTTGKEMDEADYFFGAEAPVWFNKVCGAPVEREELLEVFNKIFSPKDDFLFYKTTNKEVYVIIVPLKYSTNVSPDNDSMKGDFQKHAISFINEGSVNTDTLKTKLKKILTFVDFKDR